jgi:hypothetical protein
MTCSLINRRFLLAVPSAKNPHPGKSKPAGSAGTADFSRA